MTDLVPYGNNKPAINGKRIIAIRRGQAGSADYVPHYTVEDIQLMANTQRKQGGRNGERNSLLIRTIYDGCFRVSEVLSIRPVDIQPDANGYSISILGKNNKPGKVAISASLAADLQSYCFRFDLRKDDPIFKMTRQNVNAIVMAACDLAGLPVISVEHDRVGRVHALRHSGAIHRLKLTRNPKAVQDHLRHSSAEMTLRYLKTITADESLIIQQREDIWRGD